MSFSVCMELVIGVPSIVIVHGSPCKRFLGVVTLQNPSVPGSPETLKLICKAVPLKKKSETVELDRVRMK